MARSRNIKPGFFQNEYLPRTEALGRLLFIGLWTLADRDGRLEDRPMRIKAQLFPYEECDTDRYLNELQELGFLIRYQVEGKQYIQILNFEKHQNPHRNESKSIIPLATKDRSPREKDERAHADSLISDSLIPSKKHTVGLKPNGTHKTPTADITAVVDFLNEKTGKSFQAKSPNGQLTATGTAVRNLLKAGYTTQDLKTVIARKVRDWEGNPNMVSYLRPKTLFAKSNFENYHGECV